MAGRIRDDDVEEVRRRASLVDVAAEYMQVKKAGRQYKALCPFHTEKTPSFMLDPAKNLFFCHGCQEGGDVITLVMKLDALTFVEAVERLAPRAGVTLRYEKVSPGDRAAAQRRARLVEAHGAAAERYHALLMAAEEAGPARAYLRGRGFTKETVEEFRVGFAPHRWDDLCRYLSRKGFTEAELLDAGLAARSERGTLIDRFRGRVVFPIWDLGGRPVAFGARRLDERGEAGGSGEGAGGPKYLNSAESPIYKKGSVLYALHRAKGEIVKAGRALVVEGYTDVIALHQAGVRDAVATCGTALGPEHFRLLRRFTERVVLAFDSDAAGKAAAERAFEHVQAAGVDARVLVLPDGRDPADLVAEQGERAGAAVRELADHAAPIVEFRLDREIARFRVAEPEEQTRALARCLPILAGVRDENARRKYASWLAERVRVDDNIVFLELSKLIGTGRPPEPGSLKRVGAQVRVEREALKIALQYPAAVAGVDVEPEDFSAPAHRRIWAEHLGGAADPSALAARLPDEADRRTVTALAMEPLEGPGMSERLAEEIFSRLKEFSLSRQIDEVKSRLQRINPLEARDEYEALFEELISLEGRKRRVSAAAREEAGGPPGEAVASGSGGGSGEWRS